MLPAFAHITLSINVANLRTHNIFHMQWNWSSNPFRNKAFCLLKQQAESFVPKWIAWSIVCPLDVSIWQSKTRRGKSLCDLSFDMLLLHSTVRVTVISCTWYVTHNALCAVHIYVLEEASLHVQYRCSEQELSRVMCLLSFHHRQARKCVDKSSERLLSVAPVSVRANSPATKLLFQTDTPSRWTSLPPFHPPQPLSPHDADARGPLFSDHPCFTQTIHSLGRCSVTKTRLQAPSWQDCRHLHNCVCPFRPNRLCTDRWKNEILSHSDDLLAQSPLSPEAEICWSRFDTRAQSNVCFWSFAPQKAPWLHLSASFAAGQWSMWCTTN